MVMFFSRRPLLQSTPPKVDWHQARLLKSSAKIEEAWQCIFDRRRLGEPDDRRGIDDPDRLASMWVAWQRVWFASQLTPEQQLKPWKNKTSIFNAWCHSNMGGNMSSWLCGSWHDMGADA